MKNDRNIAVIACVVIVALRLVIGWQLLYEGMWKIRTLRSPTPWTSAGYLKNSQGPFRGMFRQMAGDPDELGLLDVRKVSARWDDWHKRFVKHYRLDKRQQARLAQWINGQKSYKAEIGEIPKDYNNAVFEYKVEQEIKDTHDITGADARGRQLAYEPGLVRVRIDGRGFRNFEATDGSKIILKPDPKRPIAKGATIQILAGRRLMEIGVDESVSFERGDKNYIVVDGRRHLTTPEREKLIAGLEADGYGDLVDAVHQVYKRAKDGISFKERLSATIRGNPDWVSNEGLQRVGEIDKYLAMLGAIREESVSRGSGFQLGSPSIPLGQDSSTA